MATHQDTNSPPLYAEIAPFFSDALCEGFAEGAGIDVSCLSVRRHGEIRHGFYLDCEGEPLLFLRTERGKIHAAPPYLEGFAKIPSYSVPDHPSGSVSATREVRSAAKDLGRRLHARSLEWLAAMREKVQSARDYAAGSEALLSEIAGILGENVLHGETIYVTSGPNRRTHGRISESGPDAVRMDLTLSADTARLVAAAIREGENR